MPQLEQYSKQSWHCCNGIVKKTVFQQVTRPASLKIYSRLIV
jgi:hypothetical protein